MPDTNKLPAPELAVVDTPTLVTLMRVGTPMVVLDARPPEEGQAQLPDAVNLTPDCSESDAAEAVPDKESLIVTYCTNVQCPMSLMLYQRLKELGYENVLEYQEGVGSWAASKYPLSVSPTTQQT